jgi:hypothetical protein
MRTTFVRQNSAFRILVVATLITVASASSASARVSARYGGRGRFVSMYASDASGCVGLSVNVSKGGPNGTEETFLNYYVFDGCTNTEIAFGYGRIANADFVVTSKTATLNTTPGSNSSFPFTMQGATGSISLTFTRTGLFTYASAGHTFWENGTVAVRTHGAYTSPMRQWREVSSECNWATCPVKLEAAGNVRLRSNGSEDSGHAFGPA